MAGRESVRGKRIGLWARVKRLALTDVGALVRGLKAEDVDSLEQIMIEADFGVPTTMLLTEWLEAELRSGRLRNEDQLRNALLDRITTLLGGPGELGTLASSESQPAVMVFIGVNGVGKTTSVAKVARRLIDEGRTVLLAAADTYRAGAINQLQVWADRLEIPCVRGTPGGDPAAVAFDAVSAAEARGIDTVLIDTAGRLHTQEDLMEELTKVIRVVQRRAPGAPHETFLILDGSVGQNAVQQGRLFSQVVTPTGIILTKLDGTARGGAVLALYADLGIPIRFLGMGEAATDLEPFDPSRFAQQLLRE